MNPKIAVKWWTHAPRVWIQYFILSAGAILLAAGLSRFLTAAHQAQVWALPDPVLGIPLRYSVLMVGMFELAVALICLFGKRIGLQIGWLAWLAINFLIFQIGTYAMHCQWQGTGIGSLTDPLQLTRGLTGIIIGFIPIYLLLGSGTASFWLWFGGRAESRLKEEVKFIKMSCPDCGVHIRFESVRLGQQINCPQCRKSITLRQPGNLKMFCFFCQGHIEFPTHAAGLKLKCPHCDQDITLKEPVTL
jgi:predicted RNA-binding Zn-ribbon protein involved in translation (DUF1610 family)